MRRIIDLVEVGPDVFVQWPRCIIPQCRAGVCFDISLDFCFPHSAERLNIYPHFDWELDMTKLVPWDIKGNRQ